MFQEFYGHTAGRFCQEVYVLCYNEFLEAIRCVKEKIQEVICYSRNFPLD